MKRITRGAFGAHLKALREAAALTQEELATIAGLSVQAVSALERGERRRPHLETVRALSAALDLRGEAHDALLASARSPAHDAVVDELGAASLPLPLTRLLGRDRDLELLHQWLGDPDARLITLLGPGGVGKTRLALELARRAAEDTRTRVVFVELASIRQSSFVARAVAEALGLPDVMAIDLPRHVQALCREHPILLVLDNCEQVPDAAPVVADLARSTPSLRLLATSRAALRVRGERLYPVEPLGLQADAGRMPPVDLARVPAVRLFLERVRDVQPAFRLTAANGPTVAAICLRLDALPLALELAAPWMRVLTPEDLRHRLERHAVLPGVAARDLPERQQTMNGTVAWSYQLLDPHEQRGFRRLGVLPGVFSIEAAAAVTADRCGVPAVNDAALTVAAALIDKCLLRRIDSPAGRPTYQMLETVRAYAAVELSASGEFDDAMEGLVRYCVGEASLAAQRLVGAGQADWLRRVRDDLDSYRAALAWLIERERGTEAADIAWGLLFFWFIRGHAAEGIQWYEQVLAVPSVSPLTESRARTGAAVMWYSRGELGRARAELRAARALAADLGAMDVVALADLMTGHVEHLDGCVSAARERFADSMKAFQSLASPWGIGSALCAMGWVALAAGHAEEADRLVGEAECALRDAGPWFGALGLYVRALVAVQHRNPDAAIAYVRQSLMLIRSVHDKFAFVHVMVPLAAAAILKSDEAWAARILGARDAVVERSGARVVDGLAHSLLGMVDREGRARLGPDRWARAYGAGRTASIDALIQDLEGPRT